MHNLLTPRTSDWHKGLSGHVLIVGGAPGFSGAVRLAGEAALRVGAGLVSIAADPTQIAGMNAGRPELMCHGIQNASELLPLTKRATVIVLGPGLSQSPWAKELWQAVIATELPLIVDADGLNLLAEYPRFRENWILTPHPGEAARLLNQTVEEVQSNRLETCKKLAALYGGVCVLKGSGTIVYADKQKSIVCDKGNPGMASAGMGDVLSGVIGGLLAQGLTLFPAAEMGVFTHAAAGDLAAKEGERGTLAMDLMPYLRRLVNQYL